MYFNCDYCEHYYFKGHKSCDECGYAFGSVDNEPTAYFVGSNGENPERIYFNELEAFISGHQYIDTFNKNGEWLKAYKFVNNEYITNF